MNGNRINILVLDNSMDKTGAFGAGIDAARLVEADSPDIRYGYAFPTGSKCAALLEPNRPVHFFPFTEISKRPKDLLLYGPRLLINGYRMARLCRREGYTVIQANDLYNLTGLAARLFRRVRHITLVRRMPEGFPAAIYRSWVWIHKKLSHRIVCVSKANAVAFGDAPNVRVVYDPLPRGEAIPEKVPDTAPARPVKVSHLANYIDGKGQTEALAAWGLFRTRHPSAAAELHFFGGDLGMEKNRAFKASLEEKARQEPWGESVFFHGKSDHVERDMKESDVILNFSNSESFSRVTLEALYFGLPIVATDVGGTREMFDHGESGLLVPAADIEAMAAAIEDLVFNAERRRSMGLAARRIVRERFGNAVLVAGMKALY